MNPVKAQSLRVNTEIYIFLVIKKIKGDGVRQGKWPEVKDQQESLTPASLSYAH